MVKLSDRLLQDNVYLAYSIIANKRKRNNTRVIATLVLKALPVFKELMNLPDDLTVRLATIKSKTIRARYYSKFKMVELDISSSWKAALTNLAHELVHAEQYHTGKLELVWSDKHRRWVHSWMGEENCNFGTTYKSYRNQPWEKDAWGRQEALAQMVLDRLGD